MEWSKLLSVRRLKPSRPKSIVQGDMRDQFDRDLDRIVYSTPFRRLQDKTQVFPLEPNDSVRTRLTHSLEVSRAARGIARDVCCWMLEQRYISEDQAKSVETIAAACGLVHDLGNPPFGHSGEVAIQDWFKREGKDKDALVGMGESLAQDFHQFEGNAQTLRLLTKLQILADFHGLDLTCGTLSVACKYVAHSGTRDHKVHELSKIGYFASERETVEAIRNEVGSGSARNPITFLVEAADDAVYNAVDIEDGFKKRILDWSLIRSKLTTEDRDDPLLNDTLNWAEDRVKNADELEGRSKDSAFVQYFRVRAIGNIVVASAKAFRVNYDAIMAGDYHGELVEDSEARSLVRACTKLNRERVYRSEETLKLELMGRQIIWDLMDLFWEGIREEKPDRGSFAAKAFNLLSDNYKRAFRYAQGAGELPPRYYQVQLLTDYICGMTDTFATQLHKRVMNG